MSLEPATARKLVVTVSDDERIRDLVLGSFSSDVEVLLAGDSREALSLMQDKLPAVVIVDIQTGNAGGFDLARSMAQDARLARVPVLILIEREQDAWLAQQAGARAFARKPIEGEELARTALALAS